jgi:hypothetical protein
MYVDGNPGPSLGQAHKCGRVKSVKNIPLDNWISKSNTDINKRYKT